MSNSLLFVVLALSLSVFSACKHNDGSGSEICKSPIEVTGRNDGLGYIVLVKDGQDVNVIATHYVDTYGNDINVYSVIDTARIFSAEMNSAVLSQLQCDERIEAISYNEASPAQ